MRTMILLAGFMGVNLLACNQRYTEDESVIFLSDHDSNRIRQMLSDPKWLTDVDLEDLLKSTGLVFMEGDKIILNDNQLIYKGRGEFKASIRYFSKNIDTYEAFIRDVLKEESD